MHWCVVFYFSLTLILIGVANAGTLMILSSASNESIVDVARAAPGGLRWLQAYLMKNRKHTEYLVSEAEKANFKAIVVTVDLPVHPGYPFFRRYTKESGARHHVDPNMR